MWPGSWVEEQLPVELLPLGATSGHPLQRLAWLALRRNPRRVQLIVSPVLGKHVPADPRVVMAAGRALAARVRPRITAGGELLVFGYAETATALGHLVAAELGAPYVHSTRHGDSVSGAFEFEESHSHAATHRVLAPTELLDRPDTVVLVDDELSTGRTALATVRALEAVRPGRRYLVAALLDLRAKDASGLGEPAAVDEADVVSLARVELRMDDGFEERGRELVAGLVDAAGEHRPGGDVRRVAIAWPAALPRGGRHGFTPGEEPAFAAAIDRAADLIAGCLGDAHRVHVLGHEELMYLPLRLADGLRRRGLRATFSSTTRSPAAAVDDPGYAIRDALTFVASDGTEPIKRFAYNLASTKADVVVLVVDEESDTPALIGEDGVAERLGEVFDLVVVLVVGRGGP